MPVTVEERPGLEEPEVIIRCGRMDGQVSRLAELLRLSGARLTGEKDGQTCILDEDEVLYIDTVDKRTFLYTAGAVYETGLRLYELEERLRDKDFFRAGKSALVNFNAIQSLRPDMGGRIRLTMEGGETVYVSRQYAPWLKKRLGL